MTSYKGRRPQVRNFTEVEIATLLDLVATILPISRVEWEQLAIRYSRIHNKAPRNYVSLKQKFSVLYKSKPRTGETELPEDVRRAKSIQERILERPQTTVIGDPSNNRINRDIVSNNGSESLSENKDAEYEGVGIEMSRSLSPMPTFAAAIELNIEKEPILSPLPVVNSNISSNSFSRISTSSSSSSSMTTPMSAPLTSPLSNAARKRGRVADGILDAIEQMNAQPPPTDYMPMLFMMMQQSQQQMQQSQQQMQQQMQQSQQQMQQSNNQMMLLLASLFQNTRQKQDERE
jgi:hypothetical protein